MKQKKNFSVYISTNHPRHTVLYVGVTNNILNRDDQHKNKIDKKSFTARYNVNRVVFYETFGYINDALAKEKQIKGWIRQKKIDLINSINPKWNDLVEESWK